MALEFNPTGTGVTPFKIRIMLFYPNNYNVAMGDVVPDDGAAHLRPASRTVGAVIVDKII